MRHLVLSFLVFSVNSFPQDLHGRFADNSELAYSSGSSDSSLFTDPAPTDGSSDLFGSGSTTEYQGELTPLDTSDSLGTSTGSPKSDYQIAEWTGPRVVDHSACASGTQLACCFHGDMSTCIWYNENDPLCYYDVDLRCCQNIVEENGIECKEYAATSQGILPTWAEDFLRTEVPTGWLAPLFGGGAYDSP